MADLPVDLRGPLADRLARALDVEGKIPRALEALGPLGGREVVLIGSRGERARQLADLGARLTHVDPDPVGGPATAALAALPAESADAIVSIWSAFRGVDRGELAAADGVLRPGGRLLVVHDYGRDDVSRLRGPDLPEYGSWGRRDGPFLRAGFRIRVIHCWWTFADLDDARGFLSEAFGEAGTGLGAGLKRARLSHNVAVYHRTRDGAPAPVPGPDDA